MSAAILINQRVFQLIFCTDQPRFGVDVHIDMEHSTIHVAPDTMIAKIQEGIALIEEYDRRYPEAPREPPRIAAK